MQTTLTARRPSVEPAARSAPRPSQRLRGGACDDQQPAYPRRVVATYVISTGVRELVTYGRSPGMSLWDEPVGDGPRYLVERRIDRAALPWVVADYVNQSRRRDEPAMVMPPWDSGEQEIEPLRSSWNAPVTFVAA